MPPSSSARQRSSSVLERLTLAHVGIYFAATTWAFGGNALAFRPALAWWGTLGALITLFVIFGNKKEDRAPLHPLRWLWPFLLFNAVVLISLLTPGFRPISSGSDTMLLPRDISVWIPSAALPRDAWRALWLFDAIYISCFNLALTVKRRRAVRGLLLFAMLNALLLAVFGTLQKLSHATGLYFGMVSTRQPLFFSTFIYHNHWGAFAVLMTTVCLALAWHYARRSDDRGFSHTPGFGAILVIVLLAATEPLSGSRSCTALMALLLFAAFLHWAYRLVRQRRSNRLSAAIPLAGAIAAIVVALAAILYLAKETIAVRVALTEQQVSSMRAEGSIGSRVSLYRDTWHMAKDRPLFGWGMASYPYVFTIYQTQSPNFHDHLPIFYSAAHNDWLQSLAEHGFIGTALLGCCALIPLLGLRREYLSNSLTFHLLAGCALILLYAWVEFPLGNIAVVLTWWLCYFCAVTYAYLQKLERAPA